MESANKRQQIPVVRSECTCPRVDGGFDSACAFHGDNGTLRAAGNREVAFIRIRPQDMPPHMAGKPHDGWRLRLEREPGELAVFSQERVLLERLDRVDAQNVEYCAPDIAPTQRQAIPVVKAAGVLNPPTRCRICGSSPCEPLLHLEATGPSEPRTFDEMFTAARASVAQLETARDARELDGRIKDWSPAQAWRVAS